MAKQKNVKKEIVFTTIVFTIEYRVYPEDAGAIGEVIDKMRELGSADVIACRVEPVVDA